MLAPFIHTDRVVDALIKYMMGKHNQRMNLNFIRPAIFFLRHEKIQSGEDTTFFFTAAQIEDEEGDEKSLAVQFTGK